MESKKMKSITIRLSLMPKMKLLSSLLIGILLGIVGCIFVGFKYGPIEKTRITNLFNGEAKIITRQLWTVSENSLPDSEYTKWVKQNADFSNYIPHCHVIYNKPWFSYHIPVCEGLIKGVEFFHAYQIFNSKISENQKIELLKEYLNNISNLYKEYTSSALCYGVRGYLFNSRKHQAIIQKLQNHETKAKLQAELGVSKDRADELFKKYHGKVPFVKMLMDAVMRRAQDSGKIRTLLG